jgi:hypothetical protein
VVREERDVRNVAQFAAGAHAYEARVAVPPVRRPVRALGRAEEGDHELLGHGDLGIGATMLEDFGLFGEGVLMGLLTQGKNNNGDAIAYTLDDSC